MANKNPSLATLASTIKKGIMEATKGLHTSMPGIVESFDPVTQLASVQPAIRRIFVARDGDTEILTPTDLPLLINVPVIFPRGGGFSLTFRVVKGDECLLNFCERSIDNWHETGAVKIPGAKRFHSLSDAVAMVGLSSVPRKITTYSTTDVQLRKDDETADITIKANGDIELNPTTKVLVNGDFEVTGAATLGDTVTSNGKDISDTHTHDGSATAPVGPISPTGVPV